MNHDKKKDIYENIDMEKSGRRMKWILTNAGYDVKTIQNYLQLSCPQPIYRWFQGKILPTVDHLFMLSRLLGIHMEDFLVGRRDVDVEYAFVNHRIVLYFFRVVHFNLPQGRERCGEPAAHSGGSLSLQKTERE